MAKASNVGMRIYVNKVPFIPEAVTFASMGLIPAGSHMNERFCSKHLDITPGLDPVMIDLLADAQTSGGLLISVPEERANILVDRLLKRGTPAAHIVGEVLSEPAGVIQIR
jgi:selenide,water dikinase